MQSIVNLYFKCISLYPMLYGSPSMPIVICYHSKYSATSETPFTV